MRINRIDIDGFGIWSGLSIEQLSGKATVFYGPNEAGKTTLMQFVRTVLYGYNQQRRKRYYPPVLGGNPGGGMQVMTSAGSFSIRRTLRDGELGEGTVSVQAADGSMQSPRQLSVLLEGVDEPIYNNVFAVGLRELQELGSLNDTDAADQLYNLTAGLDRVSLGDVMRDLENSRLDIAGDLGKHSKVFELLDKRRKCLAQFEDLSQRGRNWGRLAASRKQLDRDIGELEELVKAIQQSTRVLETSIEVRPLWNERRTLAARIAGMGELRPLPLTAIPQLEKLNEAIVQQQKKHGELIKQRKDLLEQAHTLPINEGIAKNALKIEAMREHEEWIGGLLTHIGNLEGDIKLLEGDAATAHKSLGLKDPNAAKRMMHLSATSLDGVKRPAKIIRIESKRLEEAQKDAESACEEATKLEHKLKTALDARDEIDIEEGIRKQGASVTLLRRRVDIEKKVEELSEEVEDIENRHFDLLEQQVLPVQNMPWVAVLFTVGMMLLFSGMFGYSLFSFSHSTAVFLALLGAGGIGLAALTKSTMEQTITDQIDSGNRQSDLLRQQFKKAKEERDELDREIPAGVGTVEARLRTAEQKLAEFEELLPIDHVRKEALARAELAEQRVADAELHIKKAKSRWRKVLLAAGLPDTLTPSEINKLLTEGHHMAELRRKLEARQEEIAQKRRELGTFGERIGILLAEAAIKPDDASPLVQLKQLVSGLEKQHQQMARREMLRKQARQAKKAAERTNHGIDVLEKKKRAFVAKLGCENEPELRQLADQHATLEGLKQQKQKVSSGIISAIAGICPEDMCREELEVDDRLVTERELQDRLYRTKERQRESDDTLRQHYEKRGQLIEQMKQIASDRRLAECQLDLDCIERQLTDAVHKWQNYAATHWLLTEVRRVVESQRQPKTLQAASDFLREITGGTYTRIWTPFGERELMIDDAEGHPISVELLSRGTRETVFLALRLALIAAFAERGQTLPIVLDDVLVNFDARRARSTAMVIRDFAAAGHQILLFTCHEHIMKIFKSLKVEVRELPSRRSREPLHTHAEEVAEEPAPKKVVEPPVLLLPPPPPTRIDEPINEPIILAPEEPKTKPLDLEDFIYDVAPPVHDDEEDFLIEDPTELELIPEPAVAKQADDELTLAEVEDLPLPVVEPPRRKAPRITITEAAPPPKPARPVVQIRPSVAETGKPASAIPAPHFKDAADRRFTWDEPRILWEGE